MCKKREKRESEGVGVSVSFSEEKAVYNILVLRSLEKYSNLVKKKKKSQYTRSCHTIVPHFLFLFLC